MSPPVEFQLLGPLEVRSEGDPVDLGPARQRQLLAVLLLRPGTVVSREQLIEEMWGAAAPASAANMIQVYVSRLRKALGHDVVLTQSPGYVLRVEDGAVDSARFEGLLARAAEAREAGDPNAAREMLDEAL